jgi:hypothetical protein
MIKSRRLKWAGHVTRIGVSIGAHRVLAGKSEEDSSEGARIILKWIFEKWDGGMG